jgi:hypothetical protein
MGTATMPDLLVTVLLIIGFLAVALALRAFGRRNL